MIGVEEGFGDDDGSLSFDVNVWVFGEILGFGNV